VDEAVVTIQAQEKERSLKTLSLSSKFLVLTAVLFLSSYLTACGGGGSDSGGGTPPPTATEGALLVRITDAPLDNLLKFEITIVSIELDPGNVQVLPQPVRVELTSLQLTSAVLRLADSIPTGSYNRVTVQFSNPEIKFCPELPQLCGTPTVVQPALTNSTVEKTASFSISGASGTGLLIDFDLAASIQTTAGGFVITGVDPQFTVSTQTLGAEDDEFEAKGRVLAITRDTSTAGSFVLEVFGSCQRITVTVNSSTDFEDFSEAGLADTFAGLAVDQIVEVEADAESDGPILATTVELEEPDDDEEAEGTIVAEVRSGGSGAVTSFTLLVQELATCASGVLSNDRVTVAVNSSTQFRVDDNDLPGLDPGSFNSASELAVGQKVEVEPTGLLGASITAKKIQLKEQVVNGTVLTSGAVTFSMIPRSSLIRAAQVDVQTSSATEFRGVSGVGELGFNRRVRVRGIVFFVGGQYLMVASRVEAFPFT